ncbi:MAG: 50S ribosomal protein L5 [Candidatus Omnitrophica bacterium]|nr:50S ribosomal protein L5 [Candidatus Omnitrophota bacterium]MDD5487386.1 50S ribosomal protein L5 [Candidatus Omnitrophota bacterium]
MARLKEMYEKEIVPSLIEEFGYKNKMQVPKLEKIVVNVGMGEMAHQKDLIEPIRDELATITGQRPLLTRSKKAISNFKIREGVPVGYKVTLRKDLMYEFLDRLINFVIPRIRDFRGVSATAFDHAGNYTLGLKEQTIFPELELDKVPVTHGMDICFVTSAKTKEETMSLLKGFGMPFAKK